jgi:hypothetical protein
MRGETNILARSCQIHTPTVDKKGETTMLLACGNVILVPQNTLSTHLMRREQATREH